MRRLWRLLTIIGLLAGLLPVLPDGTVVAADAVVSTCDKSSFDAALASVQGSGGGTISFTCSGTITFTSQKVITSAVTIDGGGAITFDGGGSTSLFQVNGGAELVLDGMTLQNGNATHGGAIDNLGTLTVTSSTFSGNSATHGGAIDSDGTLTVATSTFSGNSATDFGGAILNDGGTLTVATSTFSGNSGDWGGVISNLGTVTVASSTFSDNSADRGGAIFSSDTLTVASSTFSVNSANIAGGAIFSSDTLTVTSSTFSVNSATDFGGAIANFEGTVNLGSSIVANSPSGGNCAGPITSQGSNLSDDLVSDNTCNLIAAGDQLNRGRLLGPLADNGGPTHTMLPIPFSPAIDAADCGISSATDQRGISRPQGPACDIGAVEVTPPPSVATPTVVPSPSNEGQSVTASASFTGDTGPFSCTVDYGDNAGPQPGTVSDSTCTGPAHTYFDDNPSDDYTVTIQVTDDYSGVGSGNVVHTVNNVAPTVHAPVVDFEPSDEGQSVIASASFTDPGTLDTHTCTVDYGDGTDPVAGTITQGAGSGTCTGPGHTYVDDNPTGTSSDDYTVTIEVTDDDTGVASNSIDHTVNNVAPVINDITTNGPMPQGQSATITVDASDVGVNDTLTYSFDCDNDGSYETAGNGNQANCTLDPAAATSTIGVHVVDDDLGVATDSVQIDQTLTLCLDFMTGAVSEAGVGGCGAGTFPLTVPGPVSTTFCIDLYDRGLRWSPGGSCSTGERPHLSPADGPLYYCAHTWTGGLRVIYGTEQCTLFERAGVIPG